MTKILCSLTTISLLLTGCYFSYDQEYLLKHPKVLLSEMEKCERQSLSTPQCELVKATQLRLVETMRLHQEDPLKFGQEILQAQGRLADAKEKMLQNKNKETEAAYNEALQTVQFMLATVAAFGPVE